MSDESMLPFLSRFDPAERAEGSLDPLGLFAIADALGVRLAPGVRERQTNPRFLTLALAGMAVQSTSGSPDPGSVALPPWLVYEWIVVESLVSQDVAQEEHESVRGIPGRDKVLAALKADDVISTANYLKSPSVFGFHGVYRVLGVKTGLFDAENRLLDGGYRVLQAWQDDNGLAGFLRGEGPGSELRSLLAQAIQAGLRAGRSRVRSKALRELVRKHLSHRACGPAEQEALWHALQGDALRSEYLQLLTSPGGQASWREHDFEEAAVHAWMKPLASGPLKEVLEAVQAFEGLSRRLTDAFDEARWRLAQVKEARPVHWLADGPAVGDAAAGLPQAYAMAVARVGAVDPALRVKVERGFGWAADRCDPATFAARLVEHHERVQRAKPPSGKRSWFDTYTDGRVAVRLAYQPRTAFEPRPGAYVQAYRIGPLWSFAQRLGRVQDVQATEVQ